MSTAIFYFTGTGNSLKVARDLAKELADAQVISIPKAIAGNLSVSADRIGIVYPVYMFGMPLIVRRFLKILKPKNDAYIFSIATCGGMAADTLGQNARQLKERGLKLSAGFVIPMPGNYTPLYGALPEKKQKKMFEKEAKRIKEIARIVKEKKETKIETGPYLINLIFSEGIYKSMSPKIPFLDEDFWVDGKCIGCGMCVKVCPVNNISLSCGKPIWNRRCEQCFACLQWCPKEAIQYGSKTIGKRRYKNPEIKFEDILA